ncbi:hypothetical protein B484DRAFT_459278 [Ochromonadaceae sp. CCMP2298]|nr:hypothetical protein B484DRAFT_459278 [Ochromonadaceae sp. CCMP2298]
MQRSATAFLLCALSWWTCNGFIRSWRPVATSVQPSTRACLLHSSLDDKRDDLIEACDAFKKYQQRVWLETLEQASAAADNATALLEESRSRTISLIEQIAQYNPTENVTEDWMRKLSMQQPSASKLEGSWKLRFTTAPDATFKPDKKGPALTSQYVNASTGILTNIIEYKENPGSLRALLVEVAGEAQSPTRVGLTFQKVVVVRNATGPASLFNKVEFPLPNFGKAPLKQLAAVVGAVVRVLRGALLPVRVLRRLLRYARTRWGKAPTQAQGQTKAQAGGQAEGQVEGQTDAVGQVQTGAQTEGQATQRGAGTEAGGAYFDVLYLDEDLRVHRTGRGDYFVQTRLYDVWDPMVGWKQICLL